MKFSTILSVFTIIILSTVAISCSNPASGDDHDHHEHEFHGAVLLLDSQELVRIEDGELLSGDLTVPENDQLGPIEVYFLDEEGDQFQPEGDEYELRWEITNTDIATLQVGVDTPEWAFVVRGESAGSTELVLKLWHTAEQHSDLETPAIPVTVN